MGQKASKAAKPKGSQSLVEGRGENEGQSPPHRTRSCSEEIGEHGDNADVKNNDKPRVHVLGNTDNYATNIAPGHGIEDEEGVTDVDLNQDRESDDMALLALDAEGRGTQVLDENECYNDGDVVAFSETVPEILNKMGQNASSKAAIPSEAAKGQERESEEQGVRKCFFFIKENVCSDWKDLAFHLGFGQTDINNIDGRNRDDKSCCMDLLEEWHKRKGKKATLGALMEALSKANLRSTVDDLKKEYPDIHSPADDFPLAQCQGSLKSYFKTRLSYLHPLAWNEGFTMKIEDIFTTVDLVTQTQQGGNIERHALPSTVDALTARHDCPKPGRIFIEGNAGIGKTTEVSKLAFDWAEGRSPVLEKYDLVFPIALRKVSESQSLTECIFDQLLPEDVPFKESDLETYLKGNDRVLIILDGFDEWAGHEGHDVTKLLTGKILRDCCLLVTTRPSHTTQLQALMCPDTRVEITGFSEDNIRTYVHKFFKGDKAKAAALVDNLDSSLIPTCVLATPILLFLTCIIWEEKQDLVLEGRIFPLYDELVLVSFLIRRHCAKISKNNIVSDQGIPDNIRDALLCAGALAFNGLLENNLVYSKEEVVKYCGEDSLQELVLLGILHRQESPSRLNPSDQFSFSHKTMQEYFAGLYFAKKVQDETEQNPLLNTYLRVAQNVRDLENVVILACAKLGSKAGLILAHLVKIYQEEVQHLFDPFSDWLPHRHIVDDLYSKCRATGNEEKVLSRSELDFFCYQAYLEIALLCFYESSCFSQFENIFLTKGVIQFSNVGPRVYNAFSHALSQTAPQSLRSLKSLRLVNTTQCFIIPVIDYLKMMNLSELNLRDACLGGHDPNTGPCARLSQQLPYLTTLRKLVLSWNNLFCSDLLVLLPSLKSLVNLEELYLSGNEFAGCGKNICELPCFLRSLKVLKVYNCGLSLEDVLQIATAVVQYCPEIYRFDYRANMTGPDGDRKVQDVLRGLKS